MTTDGPYCSRCGIHRVLTPGSECPICLDDKRRRMTEFSESFSEPESTADIDPIAVERACAGDRTISLTRHEVAAAVAHLHGRGTNFIQIGRLLGISHRTAFRIISGETESPQARPGRGAA